MYMMDVVDRSMIPKADLFLMPYATGCEALFNASSKTRAKVEVESQGWKVRK